MPLKVIDPQPALAELQVFATRAQERAAAVEEMVTGDLLEQPAPRVMIEAQGVEYELLPLACLIGNETTVVSVVAVAVGEASVDAVRQGELLNTLAMHLLESGDTTGSGINA